VISPDTKEINKKTKIFDYSYVPCTTMGCNHQVFFLDCIQLSRSANKMFKQSNYVVRMSFRNLLSAKAQGVKVFGTLLLALLAVGGVRSTAQLPGITLSTNGPLTLASGTFGSFTVTLTPVAGYSGLLVVTCTNLPAYAYCQYPNLNQEITVSGAPATMNITMETSQVNNYQSKSVAPHGTSGGVVAAAMLAPAALLLLAFRRKSLKGLGAIRAMLGVVLLASIAGLSGCASTKPSITPVGTYTIPITARSNGTVIASTSLTLKVD
jgi:hypothetical protein